MTLMMMGPVAFFAHKNGWGSDTPFSWRQLGSASIEIAIGARLSRSRSGS
jgi:hypothetical protein